MNTEFELRNHIITEFLLGNRGPLTLTEERGVVNGIDGVVRYFLSIVGEQFKETVEHPENGNITKTYSGEVEGVKTFFRNYEFTITTSVGSKNTYKGALDLHSFKKNENGWYLEPKIEFVYGAKDEDSFRRMFATTIGHELTHGYNLLQYAWKTGKSPFDSVASQRYSEIYSFKNSVFSNNTRVIANMLYSLNRMERNAYIAQLRQELTAMKGEIKDDKTAFEAIKKTLSYERFLNLEENVSILTNVKDEYQQNQLLLLFNNVAGKKYTTYNQMKKYFTRRWLKWKKAYLSQASKIVYDVYASNPQNLWMDWGENDEGKIKS